MPFSYLPYFHHLAIKIEIKIGTEKDVYYPVPSHSSMSSPPFNPSIADYLPFIERAWLGPNYISEKDVKSVNQLISKRQNDKHRTQIIAAVMRALKDEEEMPSKNTDTSTPPSKPIPKKRTLIIHNIPRDTVVNDLRYLFEKYGPIRDIYIPRNMDRSSRFYGTTKGFALIKFYKSTDAQSAYDAEFGRLDIGFRLISIEFSNEER